MATSSKKPSPHTLLVLSSLLVVFVLGMAAGMSYWGKHQSGNLSEGPGYAQDNALRDILPNEPVATGDIPQYVAGLRTAKQNNDVSACQSLPSPKPQSFNFGDYTLPSPAQSEWQAYCTALVMNDPVSCKLITTYTYPNLGGACLGVLETAARQKAGYPYCYEKYGTLYTDSGELSECLDSFQKQLVTAPAFYQKLTSCLKKSSEPADSVGSERDHCLYDLAVASGAFKVCDILDTKYEAYTYSQPRCLEAVTKKSS